MVPVVFEFLPKYLGPTHMKNYERCFVNVNVYSLPRLSINKKQAADCIICSRRCCYRPAASSSGDKSARALKTFSSSIDPLTAEPYAASRLPAAVAVDEDDDDDDDGVRSGGAAVGGDGRDNRVSLDKWFTDRILCDPRAVAHPSP